MRTGRRRATTSAGRASRAARAGCVVPSRTRAPRRGPRPTSAPDAVTDTLHRGEAVTDTLHRGDADPGLPTTPSRVARPGSAGRPAARDAAGRRRCPSPPAARPPGRRRGAPRPSARDPGRSRPPAGRGRPAPLAPGVPLTSAAVRSRRRRGPPRRAPAGPTAPGPPRRAPARSPPRRRSPDRRATTTGALGGLVPLSTDEPAPADGDTRRRRRLVVARRRGDARARPRRRGVLRPRPVGGLLPAGLRRPGHRPRRRAGRRRGLDARHR